MLAASFTEACQAAELVGLSTYARAVLARAAEADASVVSLAVSVVVDRASGLADVEGELKRADGLAVAGFSL